MDAENLYFIFENCKGGDLEKLIDKGGNFDPVKYAAELVLALEIIHSHKYMHRDMKPNNIMIGDDGHLRIIDFGEAK